MVFVLFAALLAVLEGGMPPPAAASEPLVKGRLNEFVASKADASQRFSIYIPTGYDPSRPAPILYLMDPRGRARVAAKLFQPAAERFGYILVSSHNTASDVAADGNLRAMQAMWIDSHDWFNIDDKRVYVAGFSGTARLASLIARHLPNAFTGVIGSAAAYHPDVHPSRESAFLYFGTVGDADYNFHEMERLEAQLVSANVPHRISRFAGVHSWMPPDRATEALEWFELKAMQAGSRPRDVALIDAWWRRDEEAVRARIADGRDLDAARRLAAMARDFYGLRDVADVRTEASRVAGAEGARDELKDRKSSGLASDEWKQHAMGLISAAYAEGADSAAHPAADLVRMLELERMKRVAAGDDEAALEARRRLAEMEVQLGFYLPAVAMESGDQARASYYLGIALEINDRNPVPWYLLARASARLNDIDDTFEALEHAFDSGFRDLALTQEDPAFARVKSSAEFAQFVARLRASGDTLDLLIVDRPPPANLPLR
jgi:predicted esterase